MTDAGIDLTKRAWIALLTVLLLCGLGGEVGAQANYNVVDVVIEGNTRASQSLILGVSSLVKGRPLTPTDVTETIARLYGLGLFSDVRIDAEEVTGGVKVYIVVRELPKLIGLEFEGNKKIDDDKLKEELKLGVGGTISPIMIHDRGEKIKELYGEKGYFQAEVDHKIEYSADSSEARLTYLVDEKDKVKVEHVVLNGNVQVEADKIIGKMRNRKRGFLRSSDFAQDKYPEDKEKIIEEYHKLGFIDAYLISDSMYIDTTINRMTIFLNVYEGPRYYFGDVTYEGNEIVTDKGLDHALKFDKGDVFNYEKYEESIIEMYSAYQEVGHLHAQIIDERTTRADSIIDINYDINEGLPSHINLVRIVGNTKTKDKVIRREISVLPGQVFNRSLLIRSVRDVMALNYFGNAVPNPVPLANGDVDIEFQVEEKQTGQVSAGAGYNSQDKLVGNLGLGIPNFRGNGQSVNLSIDFGSRRNSFSLGFTEPWLFGRPTLFGADIYTLNRRWYDDYTEGRQGASIRLGRRLRWPDNYFRAYASYRLERDRFHDFDDDYVFENSYKAYHYWDDPVTTGLDSIATYVYDPYPGSVVGFDEDWLTASRLSFTIRRDSRNLPEFATSGSDISYTFETTGGFMGGFWDYQKHSIAVSKFVPLFWGIAVAAKVQYGVVTSSKSDDHILVSDRFTPGGTAYDGIIRGYDDGILTPDSLVTQSDTVFIYADTAAYNAGDPPIETRYNTFRTRVRGKYMLVSNFELQIPIVRGSIYLLGFLDAGNSWLNRKDIRPFKGLYSGAGFGFRVAVPGIGTIGFDFGYPLDVYRDEGQKWHPHFQIGTTFR